MPAAQPFQNNDLRGAASLDKVLELDQQTRYDEAVGMLRALAQAGAEAMCQLGQRLLVGNNAPFDPEEAIHVLKQSADLGHAEAMAQLATLAAAGAWMPQDWPQALDLLQRAAESGSPRARAQLSLLAQGGLVTGSDESGHWRELRQQIDLRPWLEPQVQRQPLSESPRVRLAPAFVSAEICRWLIHLTRGKLRRAMMYDGSRTRFTAERTNSDYFFDIVCADVIVALLRQKIAATLKLPVFAMEPPQMLHYAPGEELKAHYDHINAGDPAQGERIVTFLLYLNDGYAGGETEFCKTGLRVSGRAGDALYFANLDASGARDPMTLHAGLPLLEGEKWLFSQWNRDRSFSG